jgi:hypothetical protein
MTVKSSHSRVIALMMVTLGGRAWGQAERVLHFAHTDGRLNMSEISTTIGTISEVRRSLDDSEGTLKIGGTPEQVALGEWPFLQLDTPLMPASNQRDSTVHSYPLKGDGENTIRVFFLPNAAAIPDLQEAAGAIRATTEMRRVATYNASRAMATRGTPDQIGLAAWIVDVLDRRAGEKAAAREYRMPMNSDPRGEVVTRIFYVSNAASIQDFQEIAAVARSLAEVRRVFTLNTPRAIVARSTPEALALADWLIQQIDKPAIGKPGAPADQSSAVYEYNLDRDNTVKVFYLAQTATVQDFQTLASRIKNTTNMRRVFTYNAPRAIAVRGTGNQVATAERMAKGLDSSR